jgi:hypothetical protein
MARREPQHGGHPLQSEQVEQRSERLGDQSRHHGQTEQRRIGEDAR